jgi:hypothetical protein
MSKKLLIGGGLLVLVLIIFGLGRWVTGGKTGVITSTPTSPTVEQLTEDKYPKVTLQFSADGHYVTVNITDLHAAALEYNLIYDATVKKSPVNTGVTGGTKLDGETSYSYKQLLGSESSGKFTYHENITNAVMELTLRDGNKYSIFSATYPFSVSPGKTVEL